MAHVIVHVGDYFYLAHRRRRAPHVWIADKLRRKAKAG